MSTIDMNIGNPTTDVKLQCPYCEREFVVHEVTVGDETDDDLDCTECGRHLEVTLTVEVEFNIKATAKPKAKPISKKKREEIRKYLNGEA